MKLKTMKTPARVLLMFGALVFFACAAYALANGWEARIAYPEMAGTGGLAGASVYVMEFSPTALFLAIFSIAASAACASMLAVDGVARRRRTYLLKDTISQCKDYAEKRTHTFRNNMFFFL